MARALLFLHPAAIDEARAALAWYRLRSDLAGAAFADELDRAIDQIAEAPERWPEHIGGTRRFLMRRFPFLVVYRLVPDGVQVIAIAHGRRRPGYWTSR